jgi:hypothetical protein
MSGRRRSAALLFALLAGLLALVSGAAVSASAAPAYGHHPHISCTPFRPFEHTHINCHGDGYLSNDHVNLTLHTKVYSLGSVNADANGAFDVTLLLPSGVTGLHTVTGTGIGGVPTDTASTQINIRSSGSGTGGVGTGGSSSGSGGLSSTGVAVISLGVVGVGLVGVGGLVLMTGRRRRRALA